MSYLFIYLQANMHDLHLDDVEDTDNTPPDPDDDHGEAEAQVDEDTSTALLAFLSKQQGSTDPGHLANVLSTSSKTKKVLSSRANLMQALPRMMKLWSMARNIAMSKSITSFTPSLPTNLKKLAHLWIEEPMEVLLVMTFTSLRNLIEPLMSEVLTITRSPTSLL